MLVASCVYRSFRLAALGFMDSVGEAATPSGVYFLCALSPLLRHCLQRDDGAGSFCRLGVRVDGCLHKLQLASSSGFVVGG